MPEPEVTSQGPTKEEFDRLMGTVQQIAHGQEQIAQRTAWLPSPQTPAAPQPTNIFADPDRAIGERMQNAIAPLANLTINNTILMARNQATVDPRVTVVFKNWPGEVDAKMNQWAPVARLDPNNWVEAAKSVMVDHLDDIARLKAKEKDTFTEGRSASGGAPSADDNWEPDDIFNHVAKNMGGITDMEAFKARRAKRLEAQRRSA